MMKSEVLAEILYKSYVDAEKPDHSSWPGRIAPAGWIDLPWGQRQQWREAADAALKFCSHEVVEDWHGKAVSS
jgi:hypothetical protein